MMRDLCLASLDMHSSLITAGLDTGFQRAGVLNAYETEAGFAQGLSEAKEEYVGAVLYPDEGHCDPHVFMEALGDRADEVGVRVWKGTEALRITSHRDGATVETTAGRFVGRTVVLVAGAWTPSLARSLGVKLPVEGAKGYHVEIVSSGVDLNVPVFM